MTCWHEHRLALKEEKVKALMGDGVIIYEREMELSPPDVEEEE